MIRKQKRVEDIYNVFLELKISIEAFIISQI